MQTANEDKCVLLIDYERQLWDNQEPRLKQRHPLRRRNTFTIAWEGGGEVAAIPSGADKIRAFHPTTYVMDGAAYLPEGEDYLNAVRSTGARIMQSAVIALDGSGMLVVDELTQFRYG